MLGTQHLALFIASGLLLNITPGQDTLYIVGRTVSQGRRAGVAVGPRHLFRHHRPHHRGNVWPGSDPCRISQRIRGHQVCRRCVSGVSGNSNDALGPATAGAEPSTFGKDSDWSIYRAGLLTNVLNPKVALFFLAFLPQFVAPAADSRVLAFLFLGAVFIFNGTLWCLFLVWARQRSTHVFVAGLRRACSSSARSEQCSSASASGSLSRNRA